MSTVRHTALHGQVSPQSHAIVRVSTQTESVAFTLDK